MKQKQSDKMKKLMAELGKAQPKKKEKKSSKPRGRKPASDKKEGLLAKVTKVITRKQK